VAEPDNRANNGGCDADGGLDDGSCSGLTGNGQLLAGFRVPTGSDGPDTFLTDASDIHFTKNSSYTDALQALFPAPPGEHWVGYVSDVRTFASGVGAENPTGIHPEFTLPAGSDGAPFAGPYHWRFAVGFRRIEIAQAGDPVDCTNDVATFCVDSPPQAQVPNGLPPVNVSDFGVRSGGTVNVPQTQTGSRSPPRPTSCSGAPRDSPSRSRSSASSASASP
jgi:hypothetical protein